MTAPTARRTLAFRDLDEVIHDVEALHSGGYTRAGAWDLAQVCGHLADWMRFPLDGFPRPPLPIRAVLAALRATADPRMRRRVLATGTMPRGAPTLRETIPPLGGDEAAAVDRLRQIIARFQGHTGPLYPSPIFGEMDCPTWTRLQLIHCAHHLGFLVPARPP
jgi:hypothetical protein